MLLIYDKEGIGAFVFYVAKVGDGIIGFAGNKRSLLKSYESFLTGRIVKNLIVKMIVDSF